MSDWQNGLFALPCGADFPGALAEGLIRRMEGRPRKRWRGSRSMRTRVSR
ncbi:hypothetical protein ACFSS8_11695 [Paracoccus kondratievae]